jgi:hypothetical protein
VKQIKVTVAPDGKVRAQAAGYTGTECLDATRAVEALGAKLADEPTDEMYDAPENKETA